MKLSNKGRYAIRALFDMAFYSEGRPTQVKDIAERQAIPPRFLEQIFQDLKRAGIVTSKRGPQGGYSPARRANEISLGDILRAMEGPIVLGDKAREAKPTPDAQRATETIFAELSERIEACFNDVTVADLCERAHQLGVRRPRTQHYVYVI